MKTNKTDAMLFKVIRVMRQKGMLSVLWVAVFALILAVFAPVIWADEGDDDDDRNNKSTIPFADAQIIFETNFTDGDTGIQISLDGEPWEKVEVKGPDKRLVEVENKGNLRRFGLTELFFESNEPNYEELPLADILALFPPGIYKFKGRTVEGDELVGEAELSHLLPCGPEVEVAVGGSEDVTISWEPVTRKIDPATESCVEAPVTIEGYEIIAENDDGTFTVELPGDATSVTVPPEFLQPSTDYKFEVLAIEANGNQTITEDEFSTP